MWKPCRPKCPIRTAGGGAKNWRCHRVAHTRSAGRFQIPRESPILLHPSRFFPAIPTCRGYLTRPILTLDVRSRLGLAFESSARGYRSPPGSPKRGLGRAPRCTPARGISRFASGGTWWRDLDVPNEGPANRPGKVGVDRTTGPKANAEANVRCRVAGKPSAAYIQRVFRTRPPI